MSGERVASISLIIVATGLPARCANACNASINSGSSVMLVWWPDKDTEIFFMIYIIPAIKQSVNALNGSSYLRSGFNVRLSSI